MRQPGYIAVEGPLGMGETSLVERLAASLGSATVLEQAEDNPFVERFYRYLQAAAIDPGYLQRLAAAYTEFFYRYRAAPLLIVDAADSDPVDNAADFSRLRQQILKLRPGRRYFNPAPLELA